MIVERLARNARLHDGIEVGGVDLQDLVHLADIERDAAGGCRDMPFQRGAGAVGDDGQTIARANLDDLHHLGGGLRKDDPIGRRHRMIGNVGPVLITHGLRRGEAISQQVLERRQAFAQLRRGNVRC
jgi:hypothetical protein